jgi:predicted permease
MQTAWRDLLLGLRVLGRNPGLTIVAVLSLALGIGANTAMFTIVNALFIHTVPVQDSGNLMCIYTVDARNPGYLGNSYLNFKDYRDLNQVFSGMLLSAGIALSLTDSREPEQATAELATGNYFELLGVKTIAGRSFLPSEDQIPGAHPVAVISHSLWMRKFGGGRNAVGSRIHLNGHPFTIIGIAPPGFQGTSVLVSPDVWVPMMMYEQVFPFVRQVNSRRALYFSALGRLKPGVSREQAEAAMKTLAAQLASTYPQENKGRSITLLPLTEGAINPNLRGRFVRAGWLMMAIVGLVLLIACVNVANLLLARADARRKEFAIRISLGATRGRIVRQLLTESVLLSACGGLMGVLLAWWARSLLWSIRPPMLTNERLDLAFDFRVLLFTLFLSLFTGLLFGLAPALQTTRTDLVTELKERTSQFVGAPRAGSLRNLLVIGQVALSLVALIGAGLFVRSMQNAQRFDLGFESQRMLLLAYDLNTAGYNEARGRDFHRRAIDRVAALPSVQSVALASTAPLRNSFSRTIFVEGQTAAAGDEGTIVLVNNVSPEYFRTMSIPIVKGRGFTPFDTDKATRVAVVNQTMAKYFWPESDGAALGKHFRFHNDQVNWQIVGIARDATYEEIGEKPRALIYMPMTQVYSSLMNLHVRTAGNPSSLMAGLRKQVQALDPGIQFGALRTVPQLIDQSLWAPRIGAALLSGFGFLALLLAIVGIYGVISFSVNQRMRDIGVRMALGATPADILKGVMYQGCALIGAGVAAGIGCAFLVTHLLSSFLFGVSATDPLTFAGVAAILSVVGVAACLLPALKATRVHPAIALRNE